MSCSGPCDQGKKPCPCPQSCQLKHQDTPPNSDLALALAIVIGVWVVAVVIVPMLLGHFL